MNGGELEIRPVDAATLRELFNEHDFWGRVVDGELFRLTLEEGAAPLRANQPPGTVSRIDAIYDKGAKVAEVHYYLRRDGSLGGSGKPDPKAIVVEGVLYVLEGRRRAP